MAKSQAYVKPLRFLEHEIVIHYWLPYKNARGNGTYGTSFVPYAKILALPEIPSKLLLEPHRQFEIHVPVVDKTLVYMLQKSEWFDDELHGPFLK